jgi:hypothetical protein
MVAHGSTCAAPPPSLKLTAERSPFSLRIAEDGLRGQKCFSAAADPQVSVHSSPRRRVRLHTCVAQPCAACARRRQASRDTRPAAITPAYIKRDKGKKSAPRGCVSLDHGGPSKALLHRRNGSAGVPAGVWTKAEPKAFARRVTFGTIRWWYGRSSSAIRWRTSVVPCFRSLSSRRASVGAVAVIAFGVPHRAVIRRPQAPRALCRRGRQAAARRRAVAARCAQGFGRRENTWPPATGWGGPARARTCSAARSAIAPARGRSPS